MTVYSREEQTLEGSIEQSGPEAAGDGCGELRAAKGAKMGSNLTVWTGVSCLVLVLSGCDETSMLGSSRPETAATAAADRPAATRLVERDIEAPDVFQKTEAGLWDGRPSLGGVWVAHPDVTDPERVLIRNTANGETVIGALFRRERAQPGPRFQVSSDAASALQLLAGAPTELSVTALRRAEEPAAAEPASETAEPAEAEAAAATGAEPETATETAAEEGTLPSATEVETAALDPVSAAAAAIDRAEAQEAQSAAEPSAEEGAESAAAAPADTPGTAGTERPRGLFGLFRRSAPEPISAIPDAVAAAAEPGTVVNVSAPAADAPGAPAETSSRLSEPYVQLGIFSVEDNAQDTAALMRRNGVVPLVLEQQSAGKTFYRVLAGPAQTRSDRTALLGKVKGLGFNDAYPTRR